MRKLTIDFETRSAAVLKKVGSAAYADDPSTEVICLAVKKPGEEPRIWYSPKFGELIAEGKHSLPLLSDGELRTLVGSADILEAHNAQFEYFVWKYVMPRYGFACPPRERFRCSAAKAAVRGLPRDLDSACRVAGVSQQKDREGAKLMRKLCSPAPVRKGGAVVGYEWKGDAADFIREGEYCMQDVRAEEALSDALPDLSAEEQRLWLLDLEVNDRGIRIDLPSARAVLDCIGVYTGRLEGEFRSLTGLSSPRQRQATLDILNGMGQGMGGLTRKDVEEASSSPVSKEAGRILSLRRSLSMSSTAKYQTMVSAVCRDGRIRGSLMYHGAGTGRWAGRLIQPQNFPRGSFRGELVDECIRTFREDGLDAVELFFGDPMEAASTCLRGMIIPSEGCDFICADYSSVEGRVLAWLAGEQSALDVYRSGRDPYKVAASAIYGVGYDDVANGQRQIGKVAELALGYQGSVGAFHAMAQSYGVKVDDATAKGIVSSWRESRPATVGYWRQLEEAVGFAVGHPGTVSRVRGCRVGVRNGFLCLRLPSGRLLWWANPRMEKKELPFGRKDVIAVDGVNSVTRKWETQYLYGGLLAENVTQATARDLLREAMFNVSDEGYRPVLHIHDELLSEIGEGQGSVEEYEELMCRLPAWAGGLPLKAEGWRGKRYRK